MDHVRFCRCPNNRLAPRVRIQNEVWVMAKGSMQAAVLETFGAPFRVATVARPDPGPGQVLVRIAASAVNPLDVKIHQGEAAHARQPLPAILGIDLAGTIQAIGPGATGFRRGDEVYGMTGGVGGLQGSLAEFAAVDARLLAPKPTMLSMREAAALPLTFITAWEGLVDRAAVKAGQRVLIQGGAGGVGHIAIQIAHAFGAEVFATGSERDRVQIERLGATAISRETPVEAYVAEHTGGAGFDIVYDTVGGAVLDASFQAVRRFGHVVSALGWGTHLLAPLSFRAASYSGVFTLLPLLTGEGRAHHGEIMRQATRLTEMGKITPKLDPRRFTLTTACDAYRAIKARDADGKLIVDIAGTEAGLHTAHDASRAPVPA
jgi:NADPH2:quinone reductase